MTAQLNEAYAPRSSANSSSILTVCDFLPFVNFKPSVQKSSLPLCCSTEMKFVRKIRASSSDFDHSSYFIGFSSSLRRKKVRASSPDFARVRLTLIDLSIVRPSVFIQKPISFDLHLRKNLAKLAKFLFYRGFGRFEVGQLQPFSLLLQDGVPPRGASYAIFFTSLPSFPSVQNLLYC